MGYVNTAGAGVYNGSAVHLGTTLIPKLPADESFLTTNEVLEHLSLNLRTVYRLIKGWNSRSALDRYLTKPFGAPQVLGPAARALGAPAA
jgi:hypothetical protein